MWIVLIGVWSFVGVIVTGGPATARTDRHGPYCELSSIDSRLFTGLITTFRRHCGCLVLDIRKLYFPAHRVGALDRDVSRILIHCVPTTD
jgi:hypothetical protein